MKSNNVKTCIRKQDSLLIFAVSLGSKFPLETCYTLSSLGAHGTAPCDPVSVCPIGASARQVLRHRCPEFEVPQSIVIHSRSAFHF